MSKSSSFGLGRYSACGSQVNKSRYNFDKNQNKINSSEDDVEKISEHVSVKSNNSAILSAQATAGTATYGLNEVNEEFSVESRVSVLVENGAVNHIKIKNLKELS